MQLRLDHRPNRDIIAHSSRHINWLLLHLEIGHLYALHLGQSIMNSPLSILSPK